MSSTSIGIVDSKIQKFFFSYEDIKCLLEGTIDLNMVHIHCYFESIYEKYFQATKFIYFVANNKLVESSVVNNILTERN